MLRAQLCIGPKIAQYHTVIFCMTKDKYDDSQQLLLTPFHCYVLVFNIWCCQKRWAKKVLRTPPNLHGQGPLLTVVQEIFVQSNLKMLRLSSQLVMIMLEEFSKTIHSIHSLKGQ